MNKKFKRNKHIFTVIFFIKNGNGKQVNQMLAKYTNKNKWKVV